MVTAFVVLGATLLGTLMGALLCMIPSLHIYNVAGLCLIVFYSYKGLVPYDATSPFFMAMVVAYAFISNIPMTFLGSADESAGATMLPSNDMVMKGKGRDAVLLTGVGTLFGAIWLGLLTPAYYYVLVFIHEIFTPHLHWIIGLILVHYVMSEWPKGAGRGKTPFAKFCDAWRNVFAGMATFTLAAFAGLILLTKPLSPPEVAFQNIMPIFVGFFAFPSTIQALLSNSKPPAQYQSEDINADWIDFAYGSLPGLIAGFYSALIPGITVGISCIFAGHMTNHRNLHPNTFGPPKEPGTIISVNRPEMLYRQERNFLIGGGITKIIYYVGAFLLVFVLTPMSRNGMGRGGLNILLRPIFAPEPGDYPVVLGAILLAAGLSMLMTIWFTDWTIKILPRLNLRLAYIIPTIFLIVVIYFMGGGWVGLGIAALTTAIGCIPVFYASRRSHCMAVLLVPIALNFAGYGDSIARVLGIG